MQETITLLKQQLDPFLANRSLRTATWTNYSEESPETRNGRRGEISSSEDTSLDENTPTSTVSFSRTFNRYDARQCYGDGLLESQLPSQVGIFRSCTFWQICPPFSFSRDGSLGTPVVTGFKANHMAYKDNLLSFMLLLLRLLR